MAVIGTTCGVAFKAVCLATFWFPSMTSVCAISCSAVEEAIKDCDRCPIKSQGLFAPNILKMVNIKTFLVFKKKSLPVEI